MKEIRIGILGFGTVGAGVVEGLQRNGMLVASRTGIRPIVARIADLDLETDRGIVVPEGVLTTDAMSVIEDDSIDLIVELIGGTTVARTFMLAALERGKPVVTANKALLAEHGAELHQAALANHTGIYYEASVGGGIPILRALRAGLVVNHIEAIYGILNGTCNYILTRMEREGLPFDSVLSDAQALGYAETPPDLDIDGIDTAHKATILSSMAYGAPVPLSACRPRGIRNLDAREIINAASLGFRIKLLAIIKDHDGRVEIAVEPVLVPKEHMIATVSDSFNAVFVKGDIVGDTFYYGRGAGRLPTGSAVIGDIMEAAADHFLKAGTPVGVTMMLQRETLDYCDALTVRKCCYIRLVPTGQADALDTIVTLFKQNGIELASTLPVDGGIVVMTQQARESQFIAATEQLIATGAVAQKPVRLRVENFK